MKNKSILLLWLFVLSGCSGDSGLQLWYDKPAEIWEATLPLGNGRLGMMPDGNPLQETIVLNEITLWSGSEQDATNPAALESLPRIRALLLEGKNHLAQELMYETFVCGGEGSGRGGGAGVPLAVTRYWEISGWNSMIRASLKRITAGTWTWKKP